MKGFLNFSIQVRRVLIVVIPVLLVIGSLFEVITHLRGDRRRSYDDVQIPNLLICSSPSTPFPFERGVQVFSNEYSRIFACGQLYTESPIVLHIYLYKEPARRPIDYNPVGQKYEQGLFNQELRLPERDRGGRYRVDVYLFREIIASTTFMVIDR